jgi:hypothetical protein
MNITGEAEACACAWAEEEDRKQKNARHAVPKILKKASQNVK